MTGEAAVLLQCDRRMGQLRAEAQRAAASGDAAAALRLLAQRTGTLRRAVEEAGALPARAAGGPRG